MQSAPLVSATMNVGEGTGSMYNSRLVLACMAGTYFHHHKPSKPTQRQTMSSSLYQRNMPKCQSTQIAKWLKGKYTKSHACDAVPTALSA